MFDHLLTGFDIQMKHGPVQTGPSAEEEEESKSDRISPRWKGLVWHFHSEHWGTLKWCWFDVMVGSYCFVEKVSVFNPDSPGKTAKNAAWSPERRWHQHEHEWTKSHRLDTNQTHPVAVFFNCRGFSLFWWKKQRTSCEKWNGDRREDGYGGFKWWKQFQGQKKHKYR